MTPVSALRIAIGSAGPSDRPPRWATEAVTAAGAEVVAAGAEADGLVWLGGAGLDAGRDGGPSSLRALLDDHPELRWVQLPSAGVERFAELGLLDEARTWTCAKGCYAEPVAEHAMTLALAGLRLLRMRCAATSWGREAGTSLYDRSVVILGGGGITGELLRLLAPFRVESTVVRRRAEPVPGAARTVATSELHAVLPGATVVFLALALTPGTRHIIGAPELALLGPDSHLVNVARGAHIDTGALVAALADGRLGGAGLDVTDPEPLPDGHPLWAEPRCIITPHTADTWAMMAPHLAARIRANIAHVLADEPLEGLVDVSHGY
jgi:phosphoglycerate dehydrogenase-like enzyme